MGFLDRSIYPVGVDGSLSSHSVRLCWTYDTDRRPNLVREHCTVAATAGVESRFTQQGRGYDGRTALLSTNEHTHKLSLCACVVAYPHKSWVVLIVLSCIHPSIGSTQRKIKRRFQTGTRELSLSGAMCPSVTSGATVQGTSNHFLN